MTETRPIQKVLQDIIATHDFEKLEEFSQEGSWSTLSQDERELLARLFVLQAEDLLRDSSEPAFVEVARKSFNRAIELAPLSSRIWYQRGLAFAKGESEGDLLEAIFSLEEACRLNSSFFEGCHALANALCRLSSLRDDESILYQANSKFEQAEVLLIAEKDSVKIGEFYWHWGHLFYMIAKQSGEAYEFYKAVSCYKKAADAKYTNNAYYNDYGNALVEFATLINCEELIFQAIDFYLQSFPCATDDIETIDPAKRDEFAGRYFNLASCYYYLFGSRLEKGFFLLACDCFEKATKLDPLFFQSLFHWGNLLFLASKLWQDAAHLRDSCDKFSQALKLSPSHAPLIARFSESLSILGSHEEEMEHLYKAQEIILRALNKEPLFADLWASYGHNLCQFGLYFGEERYFQQALSNIDHGLTISPKHTFLWHQRAIAQCALGEISGELNILQNALNSFSIASSGDIARFGHFWNDWGVALLNVAENTREKKYLIEAEEKFEKSILLHDAPEPEWLFNYGCTLDFLGDFTDDEIYYERAIQALNAALTLEPAFSSARCHLACVYTHLGELTEEPEAFHKAIDNFQQLIEDDQEDDIAYNEFGVTLLHLNGLTADSHLNNTQELLERAETLFLKALMLGNTFANYNLACLFSIQNNLPSAVVYFEKAIDADAIPTLEEILVDDWLENLRQTQYFHDFLQGALPPGLPPNEQSPFGNL